MRSVFSGKLLFLLLLCTVYVTSAQVSYSPNSWTKKTMSFAVTGTGIIAGTADAGYFLNKNCSSTQFYKFSATTGAWTAAANMPVACPLFTTGIGTRLYVGFSNGSFYYFDSADNIWHSAGTYPFGACAFALRNIVNPAVTINGKAYVLTDNSVATGSNCGAITAWNIWEFNPSGSIWTNKATVPLPNMIDRDGLALFAGLGKLFVGLGDYNNNSDIYSWDPTTGTWALTTTSPYNHGAATIGAVGYEAACSGKVYILGGHVTSTSIGEYRPATNDWYPAGPMVNNANGQYVGFRYGSTFTLNSKVYVMQSDALQGFMWESSTALANIATSVSATTICTKANFNITYNTACTYNPGNVFTAQLSDINGSFASPTVLGTSTATSGTMTVTMPSVLAGTGYRVRIVSSSPYIEANDNGTNLTIVRTANTSLGIYPSVFYVNEAAITLSGGGPVGGTYSGPGVSSGVFNPATAGLGTHTITYNYNQCSAPVTTQLKVVPCCNPVIALDYSTVNNFCAGGPKFVLSASRKGTFNAGNIFTAQLSDASGIFGSSPLAIGTFASTTSAAVSVSIPPTVPAGTNYRMRIISSNPATVSVNTSAAITIGNCSIQTGAVPSPICGGSNFPISYSINNFPVGSEFMAQLSDASGSFSGTIVNLGTGNGSGTGTFVINCYLPPSLTPGSNYRIRVVQMNGVAGTDNGSDLTYSNTCASLTFDGVDDQVVVPNHAAYQIGSGDFALGTWVKLSNTLAPSATATIVSKRNATVGGFAFGVTAGNKVFYKNASGVTYTSNAHTVSVFDGLCHFIAISRNAGVLTYSIDGTALGTTNDATSWNTTADLLFGLDYNGINPLKGQLNDVRLYNVALTPADFNKGGLASGLMGFYNFKEIGSEVVVDGGTAANNGYLGNNNTLVDAANPQRTGNSCYQWDRKEFGQDETNTGISVQIYPNPFEESVTLEPSGFTGEYLEVSFTDLNGSVIGNYRIGNNEKTQLNPVLNKGIYIVKVKDELDHYKYYKLIRN